MCRNGRKTIGVGVTICTMCNQFEVLRANLLVLICNVYALVNSSYYLLSNKFHTSERIVKYK